MNVTELLTDLASNTNAIIRATASMFNLTASQAFHLLSIPFDGIPMSGLASWLGLDNSTLTRNIQKLEALGLVKRGADNHDKRIQRVILTKDGASLVGSLETHIEEQFHDILEQIDLDTQEHLLTDLEKLSWAMGCSRGNL
tara:strand:- start:136 stop:558 length:423 start_codon:yes stop_codon:yes gene_type:complete